MCGRFVVSYTYEQLLSFLDDAFDIVELNQTIQVPSYNVAPGQQVLSVINDGSNYRAGTLRWGLVPSFSKDEKIGYNMINARSETILSKPSFKSSFSQKRCLILANGFYEWKRENKTKTPMYITLNNKEMLLFAGLYSSFKREDGSILYTTTIITTEANELMSDIHDRMPVILSIENAKEWLNKEKTETELVKLLTQYPSDDMTYYEVSSFVNNASNNQKECIERV